MLTESSLSLIVPALNEEENLAATIGTIKEVVASYFADFEVIVFDDGSSDATGTIADRLAREDARVRVVHHLVPRNLGGCYREGIALATKAFLIMVPGDNECGAEVLHPVLSQAGRADIIIPFTENPEVRPLARRLLSGLFVRMLNGLSGAHLRYYNGAVLHRTDLLKKCRFQTNGFGYQAELLVRLLARGASYVEVPTRIRHRPHGKSKAFRLKNLVQVARCLTTIALVR